MKVKVYSTPVCFYCNFLKEWLKENNIDYEDINVFTNEEQQKIMIEKSGQMGVPVIDIDGKIIIGFEKEILKKILNIKK